MRPASDAEVAEGFMVTLVCVSGSTLSDNGGAFGNSERPVCISSSRKTLFPILVTRDRCRVPLYHNEG